MARWCIVQNQYPTLSKMLTLNERAKRQWKHCTFERLENHHTLPQNERTKTKGKSNYKAVEWRHFIFKYHLSCKHLSVKLTNK